MCVQEYAQPFIIIYSCIIIHSASAFELQPTRGERSRSLDASQLQNAHEHPADDGRAQTSSQTQQEVCQSKNHLTCVRSHLRFNFFSSLFSRHLLIAIM